MPEHSSTHDPSTGRPDPATRAELQQLETSLWVAKTRYDQAHLERTFHPDFTEVGQSGRLWTRAESMAIGPDDPDATVEIVIELPLPAYDVTLLGPDAALARYLSRTDDGVHHRTSVWVRDDGAWRLLFHQGTPARRAPGGESGS